MIEPIPGVVLIEAATMDGRRCYILDRDTVDYAPAAWAAVIDGRRIDLHCPDATAAPRYTLRLVREVMLRTYENAGGIVFHAAAVEFGGKAVMVCGRGTAGKTTAMTALLRRFRDNAALLSNDRVIFYGVDQLVAVPLPVRAARGTIEEFGELTRAAADAARARLQQSTVDDLPADFGTPVKLAFPARSYADAFGARLSATARLSTPCSPTPLSRPRSGTWTGHRHTLIWPPVASHHTTSSGDPGWCGDRPSATRTATTTH